MDASQVCGSMTMSLNRDENLSEHSLKTFYNNLDGNLHSGKSGQSKSVFVINLQNANIGEEYKFSLLLYSKKDKVIYFGGNNFTAIQNKN